MAYEYVSDGLATVPSNATGSTIAGPGSAWTSTAYTQLIASTATPITLAGVVFVFGTTGIEAEIDIAKGGAGSEVVVATLRAAISNVGITPMILPFPLAVNNIGSGQRVSWRLRISSTSVANFRLTLIYYATSGITTSTTTTKPSKVYPPSADGISVDMGSTPAWVNSAWLQITAATTAAIVVGGAIVRPLNTGTDWELDLGVGPAGAEQVVTTFRGHRYNLGGSESPCFFPLIPMLDGIASGSRLAFRYRKSQLNSGTNLFSLLYYEKPL